MTEKELVTFVQFSDKVINPDSIMRDYYHKAYANMEGYYLSEHYMEIPLWIPIVTGMLSDEKYEKSLHIVKNMQQSLSTLQKNSSEKLLFSVMDVNIDQICNIARQTNKQIILGGYTNPADFVCYKNIRYLSKVEDLSQILEVNIGAPPDYSLFEGEKCIPRLTLSKGCLFRCTFCTVPTVLTVLSEGEISGRIEALKPLDFKLIYINDKSFSQANNWRLINQVRELVRRYNQDFQGFVVQTLPSLAFKNGFLEEAVDLGVKYMEIGVETVNDKYLEMFNKPYRVRHLEPVCEKSRQLGLKIIPNLIMGIPGDDYKTTIEWVARNRDIIPVVNIYFLSVYNGSMRGDLPVTAQNIEDRNENIAQKSWLSIEEIRKMKNAIEIICELTVEF